MVEDKINIIKERVHWTYERAKDKGKRILKKLGVKDAAILCLRPDGIFPYPKDCSKFVNCWRSRPSLQRCAPGTLFNSAKGYCDFPAKAICPSSRAPPSGPSVTHVVPPPSGQRVRLRGGDVPWAGYVQVSGAGVKWGLVTDTLGQWTREDASVVCRSLGFTRGAESAFQGRAYGLMPVQSAVLRQVECEGSEEHLLQCQLHLGSQEDVDKTVVGVRCQRNWVSECREDGVRWGNKCYYMVSSSLVSHAQARDRCSSRSARLLSITSQAENDFVSEMLTSMAGDSVGFHTGGVKTQVFDDIFWLWQNTSYPPTTALSFTHWWPGWNVTSSRGQSDGNGGSVRDEGMVTGEGATTTQCVVIKDNFPVLQNTEGGNARTSAPADYYFWQVDPTIIDQYINVARYVDTRTDQYVNVARQMDTTRTYQYINVSRQVDTRTDKYNVTRDVDTKRTEQYLNVTRHLDPTKTDQHINVVSHVDTTRTDQYINVTRHLETTGTDQYINMSRHVDTTRTDQYINMAHYVDTRKTDQYINMAHHLDTKKIDQYINVTRHVDTTRAVDTRTDQYVIVIRQVNTTRTDQYISVARELDTTRTDQCINVTRHMDIT
ncbi:uncharacterized protein [Panulirus ornatus]|uniref:uncharacterized protein n=1 Tax=Panulirus ornatus TaxID=150431 RepID=UPI003A878155